MAAASTVLFVLVAEFPSLATAARVTKKWRRRARAGSNKASSNAAVRSVRGAWVPGGIRVWHRLRRKNSSLTWWWLDVCVCVCVRDGSYLPCQSRTRRLHRPRHQPRA